MLLLLWVAAEVVEEAAVHRVPVQERAVEEGEGVVLSLSLKFGR